MRPKYENFAVNNSEQEKDNAIPFSTTTHAIIGIKCLVNKARLNINIFIDKNRDYFSTSDIDGFFYFLNNNKHAKINIVLFNYTPSFFNIWKEKFPKQINIYNIERKDIDPAAMPFFLTIDDKGYLLETSKKEQKQSILRGIFNFGDVDGTEELNNIFNKITKVESNKKPIERIYCKDCTNLICKKGYGVCDYGGSCNYRTDGQIALKLVDPSNIKVGIISARKGLLNENYDCKTYNRKWWKFFRPKGLMQ